MVHTSLHTHPGGTGWDGEQSRKWLCASLHTLKDVEDRRHRTGVKRDKINLFTARIDDSKHQGMKTLLDPGNTLFLVVNKQHKIRNNKYLSSVNYFKNLIFGLGASP